MAREGAWPALVGRQADVDRIAEAARQAASGRGTAFLLQGEPGIGKTTMLDAVASLCADLGLRVRSGAAEDVEQRLPFAVVRTLLGPEQGDLAAMLRGEGALGVSASAASYEFAVTEAVLDLVDRWCAAGPVALLVDDVHWADPASLVVLHRLARDAGEQPLLLVLAGWPETRSENVAGLIRGLGPHGLREITLDPLPEPVVTALVQAVLGRGLGPRLRRTIASAAGNPLYVTELLAALGREGLLTTTGPETELAGEEDWLPRSLVEIVLRRLDFLPRQVRQTLQTSAVLGPVVDVLLTASVLGESVGAVSESVLRAREAGLLAERDGQLVFRRDLIRLALAEDVPVTLRDALHQRAGEVMIGAGAPVERVAEQLAAGDALDAEALEWLGRSADALLERAPATAVRLLRRAADETGDERLRLSLVRALLWAGDPVTAEATARAATEPAGTGELTWFLAQACYQQGRLADTVAVATQAGASGGEPGWLGRLQGLAAICLFYLEQFAAGETASAKAVELGQASGDRHATGLGYLAQAALRFAHGDMEQALAYNDRSLAVFGPGIRPDLQADPYTMRGYCLLELDRLAEADEALATAVRQNQRSGGVYLALAFALRARLRLLDGRWDDALAEIQAGLDGPDPLGQAPGLHGLAALIAVHRGVHDPRRDVLPVVDDSIGWRKYGHLVRWAQALLKEAQSGPQEALELLYPVWETASGLDNRRVMFRVCPDLTRLAAEAGDRKRATELAISTAELAATQPTRSLTATAMLCQGMLDHDPDAVLRAADEFRQVGWPLYEGGALENAAALWGGRGEVTEARRTLEAALTLYNGLDAGWSCARAEARLREYGVRRGVQGPRNRPKVGWAALTATENKVADLVAEGLSNPQIASQMFLSRRTVQSHVSSILTKLQVGSRVEVAVAAAARGR